MTARQLIDQSTAILLDFDGPVCSVFAGRPAAEVASELRASIAAAARTAIRLSPTTNDPLQVLHQAWENSPAVGGIAERLLAAAEMEAVNSAEPTAGAREFLEAMHKRGKRVAIVSNNGEAAIRTYLTLHGLTDLVIFVSGRDPSDVRLMKPNPRPLLVAMSLLGLHAPETAMIGDSASDIAAAHAAEVRAIAFAKKRHKSLALKAAGPDATIASMWSLVS